VDYIERILGQREVKEKLINANWHEDKVEIEIDRDIIRTKLQHVSYISDPNEREKIFQDKTIQFVSGRDIYLNIDLLRRLCCDTVFCVLETLDDAHLINRHHTAFHPYLPIVKSSDIFPLRWCHAEVAMMPNEKGELEFFFFE
jgi:hypothetical protein